jgi:sulfur carrier protein
VADLVLPLAGGGRGIAVARNGEVVPRSEWLATRLDPGDLVEVLTAAQGG